MYPRHGRGAGIFMPEISGAKVQLLSALLSAQDFRKAPHRRALDD